MRPGLLLKPRAPILPSTARALALAVLSAAAAGAGCAHTINYLDPAGPRYEDALAAPEDPAVCGDPARAFTVVTFNIEYGKKLDGAIDVLRSEPAVKDADVLFLQEMNAAGVKRIAAALSLNYLYFPSGVHPLAKQEFGTAVLSRWPLEGGRKIVLPHQAFGTNLRRAVTQATVRCGTHRIEVMSVHLPSPPAVSHDQREDQIETILASARSIPHPLIVAGDFNARWVGSLFEKAGFAWPTKNLPGTASVLWMRKKFDHVFARGLAPAPDGRAAGVGDAKGSSDHRPVWVRLQMPGAGLPAQPAGQASPALHRHRRSAALQGCPIRTTRRPSHLSRAGRGPATRTTPRQARPSRAEARCSRARSRFRRCSRASRRPRHH